VFASARPCSAPHFSSSRIPQGAPPPAPLDNQTPYVHSFFFFLQPLRLETFPLGTVSRFFFQSFPLPLFFFFFPTPLNRGQGRVEPLVLLEKVPAELSRFLEKAPTEHLKTFFVSASTRLSLNSDVILPPGADYPPCAPLSHVYTKFCGWVSRFRRPFGRVGSVVLGWLTFFVPHPMCFFFFDPFSLIF